MTTRAWLALGVAMGVFVLTASCGSDEATGNGGSNAGTPSTTGGRDAEGGEPGAGDATSGGDPGGKLVGGAGGTSSAGGGTTSKGGSGGTMAGGPTSGGSGGSSGGGIQSGKLGADCLTDDNCGGLQCLPVEESGIPKGLCTAGCDTDVDCPDDGVCLPSDDPTVTGICMERCAVGPVAVLDVKCHDRNEVTCSVLYFPTGNACTSDTDCAAPTLCDLEGECRMPTELCFPHCGNETDCPAELFCNPRSGFCEDVEPMGEEDGMACDPEAAEDPCLGRCATFVDDAGEPVESICVSECKVGYPGQCGWAQPTEPAPAFCLPRMEAGDTGDEGLCYPLCDCSEECNGTHKCFEVPDDTGEFAMLFGHRGICFSDDGTATLEACQ